MQRATRNDPSEEASSEVVDEAADKATWLSLFEIHRDRNLRSTGFDIGF
jgi:hypothetical protein